MDELFYIFHADISRYSQALLETVNKEILSITMYTQVKA